MFEAIVYAAVERVFEAISADPSTWKQWFPGFSSGGYVGEPALGAKRWVRVGGTRYDETMIEWAEPHRWTYRVDRTMLPMARALVERWDMEPRDGSTLVRWTFAYDPGLLLRLADKVAPKVMGSMFERAMRNLEATLRSSTERR